MVTDPRKSNRWLKVIIAYQNEGKLVPCPFCQGKLAVEEVTVGKGSTTFQCQSCDKMWHFEGEFRKRI